MGGENRGDEMNRLNAWFSPTFLDLFWFALFGHFIGYTKEETKAYFIKQRQKQISKDYNEIPMETDDDDFI